MEEQQKIIIGPISLTIRQLIVVLGLMFAVIVLVAFLQNQNRFKLVEVTPKEAVAPANADITFRFNRPLSEEGRETVLFEIEPKADFLFVYGEDSITLRLRGLAFDKTINHTVSLKNITSDGGAKIERVTGDITIQLDQAALDVFNSLPITGDGYEISLIEGGVIFITGDFTDDVDEAFNLLAESGITEDYYQFEILNKDGIEFD